MDESLLHGMCLIEDTLASNESFISHINRAVLTGQGTLDAQDSEQKSNYMSSFTLLNLQSTAAYCCRQHAAFDLTGTHACLMFSCS